MFHASGATLPGGDMVIEASRGETRGNNLFHSFRVFNVLGGDAAVFVGPDGIRNVISRVTGGTSEITGLKASIIDGPLVVTIPGANFYFINPNGIILGANGFFDVSGSVYLSTADSVKLGENGVFFADPAKNSVLTTADPVAFGFLSPTPAPITLDGPWLGAPYTPAPVPAGKTFALVGGDILIQAGIFGGSAIVAPGATVSLASVASAGDAAIGTDGAIDVSGFATLGLVHISGGSFIDVGDPGAFDDQGHFLGFAGDGSGGSIVVRAGALTLSPGGLLAQTFGDADSSGAIDIAVRGDLRAETDSESGIISVLLAGSYGGLGKGPGIRLDVGGTLAISDGSFVISESYGPGAAGAIQIRAGRIEINGQGPASFTGISADNYDTAAGSPLSITTAGSLTLRNGGLVGTRNFGPGTGGDLVIHADDILATGAIDPDSGLGVVTLSLSTETTGGPAGDMTIHTRKLALAGGARVSSSTGGFGPAGNLAVNASESVDIDGLLSGIFTATAANATGDAGTLTVATPVLRMQGGVIDSTTVGDGNAGSVTANVGTLDLRAGAQIRSFSGGFDESNNNQLVVGTGNAGSVNVAASGAVTIDGSADGRPSGLLAETRGSGAGGDVTLQAWTLGLANGGTISSSSLGDGLAGNIQVHLGDSLDMSGGIIATRALTSDGGNIEVFAPRLIRLVDSQITTSVESGAGGGGNIAIDPQFVLLQNSQIIANAFGGPGGNIGIVAGQLIADPATIISASSALGIDGAVNIDAPDTDVSAGLAVLPAAYLDASSLMRAGCSAARAGLSSLVEVGRGGLPPDPDGYLPSMDLGALARAGTAVASSRAYAQGPDPVPPRFALTTLASLQTAGCAP
ncbi:filamentous hemagglutinin N-terminal domain-containing protein [Comamonadaceae bacterium G21597-S1]|nr:filamentous hemagglutinin N-terminal domain-containing protein [Comamonadaceae bacterium G21597-S1]